jgi:hypothetical protein
MNGLYTCYIRADVLRTDNRTAIIAHIPHWPIESACGLAVRQRRL